MFDFELNQRVGKKLSSETMAGLLKKISNVLKIRKSYHFSLAIVDAAAMRRFNKIYRGQDKVTDVLSFSEMDSLEKISGQLIKNYLGEIVICYSQAAKQGKDNRGTDYELRLLITHGILHLLGYDHNKSNRATIMKNLEDKILG